jgi:hypothetical protein
MPDARPATLGVEADPSLAAAAIPLARDMHHAGAAVVTQPDELRSEWVTTCSSTSRILGRTARAAFDDVVSIGRASDAAARTGRPRPVRRILPATDCAILAARLSPGRGRDHRVGNRTRGKEPAIACQAESCHVSRRP